MQYTLQNDSEEYNYNGWLEIQSRFPGLLKYLVGPYFGNVPLHQAQTLTPNTLRFENVALPPSNLHSTGYNFTQPYRSGSVTSFSYLDSNYQTVPVDNDIQPGSASNFMVALQTATAVTASPQYSTSLPRRRSRSLPRDGMTTSCRWLLPDSRHLRRRLCNADCGSKEALQAHVKEEHTAKSRETGHEEFMCHWEGCVKHNTPETQFPNNSKLHRHIQGHTQCEHCYSLIDHIKSLTNLKTEKLLLVMRPIVG